MFYPHNIVREQATQTDITGSRVVNGLTAGHLKALSRVVNLAGHLKALSYRVVERLLEARHLQVLQFSCRGVNAISRGFLQALISRGVNACSRGLLQTFSSRGVNTFSRGLLKALYSIC
ncbi:hypothetical protein B0H13DRAFT_1880401 [Mycena leptocephala]|nr:hypothetical protein B0H13DRAFT_1880401 [Mycena leptocephala]